MLGLLNHGRQSATALRINVSHSRSYLGVAHRCSSHGFGSHLHKRKVSPSGSRGWEEHKLMSTQANLPKEADAVVIGGGMMGCWTLYHLARLGMTSAVLLERDKLTSGTTWHTNGLVHCIRASEVCTKLFNVTRDHIMELDDQEPAGWTKNGALYIASQKDRLKELHRMRTLGQNLGVECHVLSPSEAASIQPLMRTDDILGALYVPGDGTVDPAPLCRAITRDAASKGAKVYEGVPVTKVETEKSKFGREQVKAVHTQNGIIQTKNVVVCAGVWSIGDWCQVGQELPIVPYKHSQLIMNSLPGIRNTPNLRDVDSNVVMRVQGDSLIMGGFEKGAHRWEKIDPDFSFGLFDFDFDAFEEILEAGINRVPKLEDTGIKTNICGPEGFTPDRLPLIGEDGDVSGLFHGAGFNSSGIMRSGGCAEQLAHWILYGRPTLDMHAYNCRRFPSKVRQNIDWARERSHESYTTYYIMIYPRYQPLAGRGALTDPLYEKLTTQGCFWDEKNGWECPGFFNSNQIPLLKYDWQGKFDHETHQDYPYRDVLQQSFSFERPPYDHLIESEYMAIQDTCAVINHSSSGKMLLSGPDIDKAVDWLFVDNVAKDGNAMTNSLILNDCGGIEEQVNIFTLDDLSSLGPESGSKFLVTSGSGRGSITWRLIRDLCHKQGLNVNITSNTHSLAVLTFLGPNSGLVLSSAGICDMSHAVGSHGLAKAFDITLRVCRWAPNHWELHIPIDRILDVYNKIMDVGKQFEIKNCGFRALEIHNLERGKVSLNYDIRSDDTTVEAQLWSQPDNRDFLGKESLLNQRQLGVSKSRFMFYLLNGGDVCGLEGIVRDDELVGTLRRAAYSYKFKTSIASGYISHEINQPPTLKDLQKSRWEIESMGKRLPAKIYQP